MWEGVFRLACPILLNLSLLTILYQSFPQPKPSVGFVLWSPLIGWEGLIPFLASLPRESVCAFACPPLIITEWIGQLLAKPDRRREVSLPLCANKLHEKQAAGERQEKPIWCPQISGWLSPGLRNPTHVRTPGRPHASKPSYFKCKMFLLLLVGNSATTS